MSKIEELIAQYCPEGVKYQKFGEVAVVQRGASPRPIQKFLTDEINGVPWIKIGDTKTRSKYVVNTAQRITVDGAKKSRVLKKGDFIISNSMSYGRPYILGIDGAIHDGWASISDFSDSLNSDFLYHFLTSNVVQDYWDSKINSGSVSNLNADIIKSLSIPIPPLPIQKEIVNILDKFTALEAELEAELEARKHQYEYYRNELLSFNGKDVEWKTLGDLYDFKNGLNKGKEFFGKGTPIVNFTDVFKNISLTKEKLKGKVELSNIEIQRYNAKANDLFFTRTSEVREEIGMASVLLEDIENCVFSGFVLRARPKTSLHIPKFISYYLTIPSVRNEIIRYSSFTTRGLTSGPKLSKIKIPILSLEEQKRIVSILDKFDALVNDISVGLPAEIAARRQQYEYYRGKLLTFEPLAVAQ